MPDHLHHTLPFLINRIAATVTDGVSHMFQPLGLNVYAARVLILLHLDGDHSVGDLAQQASLDQSTMSHILRRLEKQGLVKRTRQALDNRSVLVSLTAEGRASALKCWEAVQQHDALLREGLDAVNAEVLETLLNRIYQNVPSFRAPSADAVVPAAAKANKTAKPARAPGRVAGAALARQKARAAAKSSKT